MNRYYRTLSLSHQEGPGPVVSVRVHCCFAGAVQDCGVVGRRISAEPQPIAVGGPSKIPSTPSCVQQVQAAQKEEMVGSWHRNSTTNPPRAWAWNRGESIIHPKGKGAAGRAIALTGQLDGGAGPEASTICNVSVVLACIFLPPKQTWSIFPRRRRPALRRRHHHHHHLLLLRFSSSL
jgi:hypothetical protein